MPYSHKLEILRELRERSGLTQSEMAYHCGLRGLKSHQTAGAWERGEIIPNRARRHRFIGYLWDHLRLRDDLPQFDAVWAVLVEIWDWEPISDQEWAEFTRQTRPSARAHPAEAVAQADGELQEQSGTFPATRTQ